MLAIRVCNIFILFEMCAGTNLVDCFIRNVMADVADLQSNDLHDITEVEILNVPEELSPDAVPKPIDPIVEIKNRSLLKLNSDNASAHADESDNDSENNSDEDSAIEIVKDALKEAKSFLAA